CERPPGGGGRYGGGPDLSPRPRLRGAGEEARPARRARRAHRLGVQVECAPPPRVSGGNSGWLHMASISIALSKGRIFDETAPLLARVGIRPKADPETSRKLVIGTNRRDLRLVVVRASDTPTYVQHGGADIGIAGRDVLAEHGGEGLSPPG